MTLFDNLYRRRKKPRAPAVLDERLCVNPIAFTIRSHKERTRGKLAEDMVELRAKRLHTENSFKPWESLTEVDKELWCHMARIEFLGDPTMPDMARGGAGVRSGRRRGDAL